MLDSERYQEYIKEHCKKCKNKDTDLCEIKVIRKSNYSAETRCLYHEFERR